MVVSVAPVQYFKAKRGIANGIVYFGGGLGGGAISFILNALLSRVGTAWTFRILGFITWGTGLPAACLIKQRMEIPRSSIVEWYAWKSQIELSRSNWSLGSYFETCVLFLFSSRGLWQLSRF